VCVCVCFCVCICVCVCLCVCVLVCVCLCVCLHVCVCVCVCLCECVCVCVCVCGVEGGWEARYFKLITDQCRHHSTNELLSLRTQNTNLNVNRDFKTNASKLSDILSFSSGAVEACVLLGRAVTSLGNKPLIMGPLFTYFLHGTELFLRS